MTLFERVFGGNDAVYGLTEAAIDNAIAQYGEGQAVSFPDTASVSYTHLFVRYRSCRAVFITSFASYRRL